MSIEEKASEIIKAFKELKALANSFNLSILLNVSDDEQLVLYYNEDYPDKILVDKSNYHAARMKGGK